MNSKEDVQLKTPRRGKRIAILSHREAGDSLPANRDVIEKTILFGQKAVDHEIHLTKTYSEIK
jgi:hypothetical protein